MKKLKNSVFSILLIFALMLSTLSVNIKADAAINLTGGYTTKAGAYNWGSYTAGSTLSMSMPEDEKFEWFKFTLGPNSKIFIRCGYTDSLEGCSLELYTETGSIPIDKEDSLYDVYGYGTLNCFMALNCDNTTSKTQTFYIRFVRGDAEGPLYYSFIMRDRIKRGSGTFSLKGTATNSGNSGGSTAGVDSTVLSTDLTKDSSIPPKAIVYSITSKGTMSPRQGNVHHKIMPVSEGIWYTALAANASSGSYDISETDAIPVKQKWQFCYNALAGGSSTMKNVSLNIVWHYDLADTNYETY